MKTYAVLSRSFRVGIEWMIQTYGSENVRVTRNAAVGTVILHNVERRFTVVTPEFRERLMGVELMGFDLAGYLGDQRLIDLARSRVRD